GIDTEAAAIRAPQARDHGDDLDRRCLVQRCFDEAPTGRETGELRRLPGCRQTAAEWPLRGAFGEQLLDDPAVGESEYVIEVALRVLGVAARMWAAERGDGAALPEQVADGVRQVSGLGEGADKQDVQVGGQILQQLLDPGVTNVVYLMAGL